jgi:hypothetical protein
MREFQIGARLAAHKRGRIRCRYQTACRKSSKFVCLYSSQPKSGMPVIRFTVGYRAHSYTARGIVRTPSPTFTTRIRPPVNPRIAKVEHPSGLGSTREFALRGDQRFAKGMNFLVDGPGVGHCFRDFFS